MVRVNGNWIKWDQRTENNGFCREEGKETSKQNIKD